jgi:3-phenylpropionate/cinnamic acid dioxygenase small subunit
MPSSLEEVCTMDKSASVPTSDPAKERAIIALVYRAARLADDQQYLGWMELFTTDGEYSAITSENLAYKGLRLFTDIGKAALHERAAFLMGLLQVPRGKTLRLVSNVEVRDADISSEASAVSNFIITRTGDMQHSELYASGRYLDRFERHDDIWLFKKRLVVVDSNLFPAEFTELL